MEYNKKLLARRWALNCAVALCKADIPEGQKINTTFIVDVAKIFEKYILGE